MLEKHLEQYLRKRCERAGLLCYKFSSPSHAGVSDRIVLAPFGRVWFVELKNGADGKLSKLQSLFAKDVTDFGFQYVVLRSKEDVDAFIARVSRAGS